MRHQTANTVKINLFDVKKASTKRSDNEEQQDVLIMYNKEQPSQNSSSERKSLKSLTLGDNKSHSLSQ